MENSLQIDLDFYDENLFGNEAGEDEDPEVLSSYFIANKKFNKFLSRGRTFAIVRARKGMGKSSLLSKMAHDVKKEKNAIVISITGSDLLSFANFENTDHLKLQNEWKKALSARINYELGSKIGFAWKDEQMTLVEASELSGYKDKNLVGALIDRITSKHIPIEIKKASAGRDGNALLERYMAQNQDINVWLFVDDIDSTFTTDEIQKARVSSFFSACRSLARDIKGLYLRTSVRTDVWTSIRYNEDLDKCEQYAIDIAWSRTELEKILTNKILSYINRYRKNDITSGWSVDAIANREQLIQLVFMNRLNWNGKKVPPFTPIRIFGAKRPRWMSQFCRLSAEAAADREMRRVSIQDINYILKDYGRLRINDIYKEHSHQFESLQKLIETFANGARTYNTKVLLSKLEKSFVQRVGHENVGMIDGEAYIRPLQLAQLLYRIGFIVLREPTHPGSPPSFTDFDERPELLTDPSYNYDDLTWEIHPSYRGILSIK